jgi:hypothetical protein
MPYCYRYIDGDLLCFVHRGKGVFATKFGPLRYEPRDYVSTTLLLMPDDTESLLLVVEAPQPIRLCEHELVGRHTPVDPTVLQVPDVVGYGWPKQDEWSCGSSTRVPIPRSSIATTQYTSSAGRGSVSFTLNGGAYFSLGGGNEALQNSRARAAAFAWRNRSCVTACFSSAAWSAGSIVPCVGNTQAVGQRVIPLVRMNSAIIPL